MEAMSTEHCGPKVAAAILDVSEETLQSWRKRGTGPPVRKFGRLCKYHKATLREWAAKQTG
jgi:DNA-binding transcriptional MerR regulator